MGRYGDIDALKGLVITGYNPIRNARRGRGIYALELTTKNGGKFSIDILDERDQRNDSHAYISKVNLDAILNQEIVDTECNGETRSGVELAIITKENRGAVDITHDHNGYYSYHYDLRVIKPDPGPQKLGNPFGNLEV